MRPPRRPPPPPATAEPILPAWWEQRSLPAPWARRGFLRPAGTDGGLLRPLSGDQMSPVGPLPPAGILAGTGSRFAAGGAATGCAGHLPTRHPCSRILLAGGQNHHRLFLWTRQGTGTGTEPSQWWGGITWDLLAGIPASLTAASEPFPCASRPPNGCPSSSENNQSNKRKTWEQPNCFLFMLKTVVQQDFAGAKGSQRHLLPGCDAACAAGDEGLARDCEGSVQGRHSWDQRGLGPALC